MRGSDLIPKTSSYAAAIAATALAGQQDREQREALRGARFTQPTLSVSPEIAEWNAAVDRRKAEKRAQKGGAA